MKKRITTIALAAAVATSFCLAENKVVDAYVKSMRDGSPALLTKVSKSERKTIPALDAARLDLRRSSSFGSRVRGVGEVQQNAAHAIDKIKDDYDYKPETTPAFVSKSLDWLAQAQHDDGSWGAGFIHR